MGALLRCRCRPIALAERRLEEIEMSEAGVKALSGQQELKGIHHFGVSSSHSFALGTDFLAFWGLL